jgi:hypothetical protein
VSTVRQLKRKAGRRPAPRTIHVVIESGDFEGWEATARADFRAGLIGDLQSGNIERIMHVLDEILIEHNMPNRDDEIAATMADVDPYGGMVEISGMIFDAIAKLPNR